MAYRQLALLLWRPPGREIYPGDRFLCLLAFIETCGEVKLRERWRFFHCSSYHRNLSFGYFRTIAFMMNDVVKDVAERNYETKDPFFRKLAKTHDKELLVIVTGDRGLCGNYNSAVICKIQKLLNDTYSYELVLIGKRGGVIFNKSGATIKLAIDNSGAGVTDEYLENVVAQLMELYAQYDAVSMI